MINVASDAIDVPAAEATILQIRESAAYPRTITLQNISSGAVSFKIQASADGGTTWVDQTLSDATALITLTAAGGGSAVAVERMTSLNILRIRASGGGDDRDLLVTVQSVLLDANRIWTSPLL